MLHAIEEAAERLHRSAEPRDYRSYGAGIRSSRADVAGNVGNTRLQQDVATLSVATEASINVGALKAGALCMTTMNSRSGIQLSTKARFERAPNQGSFAVGQVPAALDRTNLLARSRTQVLRWRNSDRRRDHDRER